MLPERALGRLTTMAPSDLEYSAISGASVDTTTRSIDDVAMACLILQPIKGIPLSSRRFFLGIPTDPPRAGIIQMFKLFINYIAAFCTWKTNMTFRIDPQGVLYHLHQDRSQSEPLLGLAPHHQNLLNDVSHQSEYIDVGPA